MREIVLVGVVDERGWLLLQERDEHAPTHPDQWSLVGGAVEPGEEADAAAHRELEEETALAGLQLRPLGRRDLPCDVHGSDAAHIYAATTSATDADVICGEGRQIVFVDPARVPELDLTPATRATYTEVLAALRR